MAKSRRRCSLSCGAIQKAAETAGAAAIIFEMNTYGGRLDSAEEITQLLNHAKIPTYTFINTNAGSAGSLIAFATRHIYMAPVSAIGAAAPILSTGEDLPATAREKTISYWSALIRGSATRNSHNPDVGEAFMNKEKEVKIGERVDSAKGSLLTLTAQEATERIDGKPLLADGIADSVGELVQKAGSEGRVVLIRAERFRTARVLDHRARALASPWWESLAAYLEFKIPGREFAGIHRRDLFRAVFPRALFRRPGRMGSGRRFSFSAWFSSWSRYFLRALHHSRRRRRRLLHAWLAPLGDDRSLSRRKLFPDRCRCCAFRF